MIIKATETGFELHEGDDFSRLHVDAAGMTPDELTDLATSNREIIPIPDADHLWVSVAFMRGDGASAGHDEQMDRLVNFAKERGWYDEEVDAIRAHIENLDN